MKKNNIYLIIFLVMVLVEVIFYIVGNVSTSNNFDLNAMLIFFINLNVIYLGVIYLLNNKEKQ